MGVACLITSNSPFTDIFLSILATLNTADSEVLLPEGRLSTRRHKNDATELDVETAPWLRRLLLQ